MRIEFNRKIFPIQKKTAKKSEEQITNVNYRKMQAD